MNYAANTIVQNPSSSNNITNKILNMEFINPIDSSITYLTNPVPPILTQDSNNNCKCSNIVSRVDYFVQIDKTMIHSLVSNVTVGEISGLCNEQIPIIQTFSIKFSSNAVSSTSNQPNTPGFAYGDQFRVANLINNVITLNSVINYF